jgi:hypothetical protein
MLLDSITIKQHSHICTMHSQCTVILSLITTHTNNVHNLYKRITLTPKNIYNYRARMYAQQSRPRTRGGTGRNPAQRIWSLRRCSPLSPWGRSQWSSPSSTLTLRYSKNRLEALRNRAQLTLTLNLSVLVSINILK